MASTEGLVPINRKFLASYYDKYPFSPLHHDVSLLSSRVRSFSHDLLKDFPPSKDETLLIEEAHDQPPHKIDENMWKNREHLEEILFLLDQSNLPLPLQQPSTADHVQLANVLRTIRDKFQATLNSLVSFQSKNSERVFNTVMTYMPQDFRGTLIRQQRERSERNKQAEVDTLIDSGGSIRDRYALLWKQQMDRRRQLAQLGSATGVYKTLVKYLVGVPQVLLDFIRQINDDDGPMEEQRQRYGPPLYSLTSMVLFIQLFLSLSLGRFEDSKLKKDQIDVLEQAVDVYTSEFLRFITFIRLNGNNFREWYQSILLVIKGRGKMGYLTGAKAMPEANSAAYSTWEAENSIVMAWLINSMEPKIGRLYLFYQTAKEIWEAVKEMYSDLDNISQSFEVRSAIRNTQQGTKCVTEYFNILSELWQEIDLFYDIKWTCSHDAILYNKMLEKDRIFDFLQGLNKDLDEVRGRIFGTKPLPTLKEVFAEVRREESRKRVMSAASQNTITDVISQGSALVSARSGKNNPKTQNGKDKELWCEHCNKPYHTKDTCWEIHGKPADWKPRSQRRINKAAYVTELQPFTTEQMEVLRKLLESPRTIKGSELASSNAAAHSTQLGVDFGEDDWQC